MFFSCSDMPRATLGHIGRVPIRVDATFIFVPLFYFGAISPEAPLESLTYVALVSAGLFASILLHEIGHAVAADRNRMGVDELVVGGFYGYAVLRGIAPTRRRAIFVLLAGPLGNLAMFFWLWALLGLPTYSPAEGIGEPIAGHTAIYQYDTLTRAIYAIASMNLAMFVFNLMPAFPLDGGRIYRLALSHRMDTDRATQLIAAFGMGIGAAIAVAGGPNNFIALMFGVHLALQNYETFQNPARAEGD